MFTTYLATWLPDILVESSTGTRPSVTGLSDVTQTSAVRLVTTRELPLGCIKYTRYTSRTPRDRELERSIIKEEIFLFQYQKNREKKKMLCEVDPLT